MWNKLIISYWLKSEKAMAPHSSTFAWKIPWAEEPGRLQSMGSLRVGHDWATSLPLFTFMHWRKMATHSSTLAWRIPRMGEPDGLPSMGSHRVRHDWSDLAAATLHCNFTCLGAARRLCCVHRKEPLWSGSSLGTQSKQFTVNLGRHTNKIYMKIEYNTT